MDSNMLPQLIVRPPSLARAAGGLFVLLLIAGCASKNPLLAEPPGAAKKAAPPTQSATAAQPEPVKAVPVQAAAPPPVPVQAAPVQAAPVQAAPVPTAVASAPTTAPPAQTAAKPAEQSSGVQTTKKQGFFGFLSPYRADIQQGNFVSSEMVAQLKEGMTREQVAFVLGTPLLTDLFHGERWDYVFRLQRGNGETTSSKVSVFFKENRLARVEGGSLPEEKDYLARIAGSPPPAKPKAPVQAPAPQPPSAVNEGK
jgi:outer membrane protein assembly factor BamE